MPNTEEIAEEIGKIRLFANVDLGSLIETAIILAVGLLAVRIFLKLSDKALSRSKMERAAISLIRSLLRVVLYVLLILSIIPRFGIDIRGLVAVTSVASLAISLSLQGALSNIVSGFALLTNHPFRSGDFVEIAGRSGVVEAIDIAYTKLATADNKIISIPNSAVAGAEIVNYSSSGTRRVDLSVTASYDAPTETVKKALLEAANVPTTLFTPAPFAGVKNYGDSAIEYVLQVWTGTDDYWKTFYTVNERIRSEFEKNGIEMTYPHLNVHMQ